MIFIVTASGLGLLGRHRAMIRVFDEGRAALHLIHSLICFNILLSGQVPKGPRSK